ncbi:MAG: OmpA family protein [Desulfoprunum sp.]|uniref:OmpA family protein n=1 Tax=Desulfoprunum sp. TaxID=2020866 RepID=UPI003C744BD8
MSTLRARGRSVFLAIMLTIGGCAMQQPVPLPSTFEVQPLVKEMWTPKADNLVLVLDASSSMSQGYNGFEKFDIGRRMLSRFNKTMPDLSINVELRSFGHSLSYSLASTVPVYGLSPYSRAGVANALSTIVPAGGPSPMEKSLQAVADDLKGAEGKIAMVVVSDGKDMGNAPMAAARELNARYGDRLCIYTVLVGDDAAGRTLLSGISQVTRCGQAITADDVNTGAAMADFVTTVLLDKADSWIFKDIKFESDKAVLMASSFPSLDRILQILRDNPELSVEIQGHTDSTASAVYNIDLSQRRAQAVMQFLQGKGIAAARMTARGYGEGRPIDTNDTEEGKANNRRVELKPLP